MRETTLILIEGLPGSGKSTLAHLLLRQLLGRGIDARWWYEEDRSHPLYVFEDEASIQRTVDDLFSGRHTRVIAAALAKWREFSERLQASGTLALLDSCLFGYVTWTLFPADLAADAIAGYVNEVEQIIAPLNPNLIYLYPQDVAAALRRICDRRGGQTAQRFIERAARSPYGKRRRLEGFAGMAAFWAAYRALTDALFAQAPLAKLAIETDAGDWPAYESQALDFLELARVEALHPPAADLQRFAGEYIATGGASPRTCSIRLEGGNLYLDGLEGFWSRTRLIPRAATRFEVDSFPFTVTFDDAAIVQMMRLEGPDLFGGGTGGRFARAVARRPAQSVDVSDPRA